VVAAVEQRGSTGKVVACSRDVVREKWRRQERRWRRKGDGTGRVMVQERCGEATAVHRSGGGGMQDSM